MATEAELNAEEAKLRARKDEIEAELRAAQVRLNAIETERLVLNKADHKAAFTVARQDLHTALATLKSTIAHSQDPKEITTLARQVANDGYELDNLCRKATAGEDRYWDSPEYRSINELTQSAREWADTAESLAEYLQAAERETNPARKKLFADTAQSLRRGGGGRDDGGMPCVYCGEPKWGYNDEGYECRYC